LATWTLSLKDVGAVSPIFIAAIAIPAAKDVDILKVVVPRFVG
jgi:hypothetical protein